MQRHQRDVHVVVDRPRRNNVTRPLDERHVHAAAVVTRRSWPNWLNAGLPAASPHERLV